MVIQELVENSFNNVEPIQLNDDCEKEQNSLFSKIIKIIIISFFLGVLSCFIANPSLYAVEVPCVPYGECVQAVVLEVIDGNAVFAQAEDGTKKTVLLADLIVPSSLTRIAEKQAKRYGLPIEAVAQSGNRTKKFLEKLLPAGTHVTLELKELDGIFKIDEERTLVAYVWKQQKGQDNFRMINFDIMGMGHSLLQAQHTETNPYFDFFAELYKTADLNNSLSDFVLLVTKRNWY